MKTPEELKALKDEVAALQNKLAELSEDELKAVSGGAGGEFDEGIRFCKYCELNTWQEYVGPGQGFDKNGYDHDCYLWKCNRCNNINYIDMHTGKLI